jgi:hypothetical protein
MLAGWAIVEAAILADPGAVRAAMVPTDVAVLTGLMLCFGMGAMIELVRMGVAMAWRGEQHACLGRVRRVARRMAVARPAPAAFGVG